MADKLSLNVKKTELVIFRSRKLKIEESFKFKPDGKRLVPTKSVKYLGALLDEHLHWNEQISFSCSVVVAEARRFFLTSH